MDNWRLDPLFDIGPADMEEVMRRCHAITCYVHTNRGRKKEEDWNAAQVFRKAAQFLRDNSSRDNFLLWVDCFDPHEPWDAPPEFVKMYDKTPGYDGMIDPRSFHVRNNPDLSEAARQRVKAMYKAKVSFVDKWFGVFLDALERTGLNNRTAVLLTADHGTNVGDQPRQRTPHFGKALPRENELHVPFLLSVPGAGFGQSQMIAQPQDIFATILGIAGNSSILPEGIESYDLLELIQAENSSPRKLAVGGTGVDGWRRRGVDQPVFSAFDKDWYLGVTANPESCELQRLGTHENVAKEHPDVVKRLRTCAIEEIAYRKLDPGLVDWLSSDGQIPFPEQFRATDAKPAPKGWHAGYWTHLYNSIGLPS
jgi:arylsulfatase A-like enzyme